MRARSSGAAVLAVLVAAVLPGVAGGASQTIVATDKVFTPADVTVFQGDTVTWTNGGGSHNVHFDDNSFVMPPAPDSTPWSVSRTFDSVGVFRFYCESHGYPNGVDMSGAVYVKPAPVSPPPLPQQVSADRTAPAVTLSGPVRQRVLRRRAVLLRARVSEVSSVVARAWVSIPRARKSFRARRTSRQLAARVTSRLELRLPQRALRAFRRALRKHRHLTARITVVARDPSGNRTVAKRRVRLKR